MGILDYLICLLRNLYAGQEATVRTRHRTMDWFKTGKGVCQGCMSSPCLFNFHEEYIMWNAGLHEAQAGIKIALRNVSNFRYAESEEELMTLLMKVKEESENWLKTQHSKSKDHGIWSYHFMVNRWGNSGSSDRLYFAGLQNDYRLWLQPWN